MKSSQSVVSQSRDPFSNDESDYSNNVIVHKDIGSLDATRGTDGSSAVNSLDSTDCAPSCNQGMDSHIPQFNLSSGIRKIFPLSAIRMMRYRCLSMALMYHTLLVWLRKIVKNLLTQHKINLVGILDLDVSQGYPLDLMILF